MSEPLSTNHLSGRKTDSVPERLSTTGETIHLSYADGSDPWPSPPPAAGSASPTASRCCSLLLEILADLLMQFCAALTKMPNLVAVVARSLLPS